MERKKKLHRYRRKDYDQVVDFPVEIVGRDGVIRRYSFEDSVRLYQRRIASAVQRHGDQDMVQAERQHCQRRIDQLRRSYLWRHGGEDLAQEAVAKERPAMAGEALAFVRRQLAGRLEPDRAVALRPLESDGPTLLFAVLVEGLPCLVLSLHTFEGPDGEAGREAFQAQIALLQACAGAGEGVEALLAWSLENDCALVLTGPGGMEGWRSAREDPDEPEASSGAADLDARPRALAVGRLDPRQLAGALDAFESAYEADPWQRRAYLGAAAVGDHLGSFERAAMAARMGVRYFPQDPAMAWHLAVAELRLQRLPEARAALDGAARLGADAHAVRVLGALLAMVEGRWSAMPELLEQAARLDRGLDPGLARVRRLLRLILGVRRLLWGLLGLCLPLGLGAAMGLGEAPLLRFGLCAVALGAGGALALLWPSWLRRWVVRAVGPAAELSSLATVERAAGPPPSSS